MQRDVKKLKGSHSKRVSMKILLNNSENRKKHLKQLLSLRGGNKWVLSAIE